MSRYKWKASVFAVPFATGSKALRDGSRTAIACTAGGPAARPFVTWAENEASRFEITKCAPRQYESRPFVTRKFFGECGTQLTYQHAEDLGTIDLTVASLDNPEEVAPEDHVWCDRMLPWLRVADDLPKFSRTRR